MERLSRLLIPRIQVLSVKGNIGYTTDLPAFAGNPHSRDYSNSIAIKMMAQG